MITWYFQDNISDYLKLLSFLDPGGQGSPADRLELDLIDSNDILLTLKGRLAQYLVHQTLLYVEYSVPVQLSEVQLKQYCNILSSNSHLLCSRGRVDFAESLLDVIISIRKVCFLVSVWSHRRILF